MRRLLVILAIAGCGSSSRATVDGAPANNDVATGVVAAWQAGPAMPTPRANHCSTVIGSWVLVIGGNYEPAGSSDFVKTAEIHAALLGADGTLGAWQLAGMTASPVSECNATSAGNQLYVVDGLYDDASNQGQVWTAPFDTTTGKLTGALTATGALPTGDVVIASVATTRNGELLLMHTLLPDSGNTTETLRTSLTGVPTWTSDDWKIGFIGQPQYAFADKFAYTLGGYDSAGDNNTVSATVWSAPINADGSIAVASTAMTTALPTPTTFGQAVAVDDYLVLAGGRTAVLGGAGSSAVLTAKIGTDGTLGPWTTTAALPVGRSNFQVVLDGDFLIATGGGNNGPGDALVFIARVRYGASS